MNWKPVALLHLTVNSDYLQSYVFVVVVVVVVVFQVEVSLFSSRNEFAGDSPLPTDSSSPKVHSSELKMLSVTVASFAMPV